MLKRKVEIIILFYVIWNLSWDELVRLTSWEISEMYKSSCASLNLLSSWIFFPVRMKNHYIISVNTFKLRYSAVWIIAVLFTACCVEALWICKRNKTKQQPGVAGSWLKGLTRKRRTEHRMLCGRGSEKLGAEGSEMVSVEEKQLSGNQKYTNRRSSTWARHCVTKEVRRGCLRKDVDGTAGKEG